MTELKMQSSDLDMTMKTTDSGQVSGGSSIGSHSPTSADQGGHSLMPSDARAMPEKPELTMPPPISARQTLLPPNTGPPPRHLLPAKLKPSPGVKMHPVILDFKGKEPLFVTLFKSQTMMST